MDFTSQASVRGFRFGQAPGMGVMVGTNPNAVAFRDALHLFYAGNGSDGIYYATTTDGQLWNDVERVNAPGLSILPGTSPNAAVFRPAGASVKEMYLFFNGSGHDGIWYTTSPSGTSGGWSNVRPIVPQPGRWPVALMDRTSPNAVIFGDTLYVFYTGAGSDGVFYATTRDGNQWSEVKSVREKSPGMNILEGTSPSVVVLNHRLYLFFMGSGRDSIYYTTSDDGENWSPVISVAQKMGTGMGVYEKTSPAAFLDSSQTLYLFWADSGSSGLFYTSSDGNVWAPPKSMRENMLGNQGQQTPLAGTSPWAAEFNASSYIFWTDQLPGQSAGISYSMRPYTTQLEWSGPAAALSLPANSAEAPLDSPAFASDGESSLLVWPTRSHTMAAAGKQGDGRWSFLARAVTGGGNRQITLATTPAILPIGGGRFVVLWTNNQVPGLPGTLYSCTCTLSVDAAGNCQADWSQEALVFPHLSSQPAPANMAFDTPAVGGDGVTAHLVWLSGDRAAMMYSTANYLVRSDGPVQLSWTAPMALPSSFIGPSRPAIACSRSTVLLAFCGFAEPGHSAFVYTALKEGGKPFTVTRALYDKRGTLMESFNPPVLTRTPAGFHMMLRAGLGGQEMISMVSEDGSSWSPFQSTGMLSPFACGAAYGKDSAQIAFWQDGAIQVSQRTLVTHPVHLTLGINPARWMTDLAGYPHFAARPLSEMCLIGSHDAGMYFLENNPVSAQSGLFAGGIVGALLGVPGMLTGAIVGSVLGGTVGAEVVEGLTITQSQHILDQLNSGSRYFDLRPAMVAGRLVTYHGSPGFGNGVDIAGALQQVLDFVRAPHSAEVVILKFSHPSGMGPSEKDQLSQMIADALNGYLYTRPLRPNTRLADLTYAELVHQTGVPRSVVIPVLDLDTCSATRRPGLYKYADCGAPGAAEADLTVFDEYSNSADVVYMIQDQQRKLENWTRVCGNGKTPCDLFLLSWTLTTQFPPGFNWDQISTLPSSLLEAATPIASLAGTANSLFNVQYPPIEKAGLPNRANILYFDFVQNAQALSACVKANLTAPPAPAWSRIDEDVHLAAPPRSLISTVSRHRHQVDLFVPGKDGGISRAWWNPRDEWETSRSWTRIGGAINFTVPAGSAVRATSRKPEQVDLFVVGHDGGVYTQWWNPRDAWENWNWFRIGWYRIGADFTAPPGSPVSALTRHPEEIDLFTVGVNGGIYSTRWRLEEGWKDWFRIGGTMGFTVPQKSVVTALSRYPDQIDLFVVGHDGGIYSTWWNPHGWAPNDHWFRIGGPGNFTVPPQSVVTAIAREPHQIDLFVVGHDGAVYSTWWNPADGWELNHNWFRIGAPIDFTVPTGSVVSAVSRYPDHMDLFVVGHDGGVHTIWWNPANGWETNHNWFRIGGASNFTVPQKSVVKALARKPDQMDLFVVGHSGEIFSTGWNPRAGWAR